MTRAPLRENAKRSVMIAGHRTSVSLEAEFWGALQEIALGRGQSVQALIGAIDSERGARNLSSAIRVFVLHAMKDRSATVIADGGDTSADLRLSPE
ncbi:ribbon-helix-helix domain-containing protein [Methylobacterium sp. J-043]|nr:ribbon-helix-helix domain-containing protein [Methylobacterium sp. J-043]